MAVIFFSCSEELRKKNGERTPFIFSNPLEDIIIHRGFVEFPPGIKIKVCFSGSSVSTSPVITRFLMLVQCIAPAIAVQLAA